MDQGNQEAGKQLEIGTPSRESKITTKTVKDIWDRCKRGGKYTEIVRFELRLNSPEIYQVELDSEPPFPLEPEQEYQIPSV